MCVQKEKKKCDRKCNGKNNFIIMKIKKIK